MIEYPKIETLFDRGPDFKVRADEAGLRLPEFDLVERWLITEKVDGTNIRMTYFPREDGSIGNLVIRGRTEAAQIPPKLEKALVDLIPMDTYASVLTGTDPVTLYGEGYGPGIQKGGVYRSDPSFRLFDIKIGEWWLNWLLVEDIAKSLGIKTVPVIGTDVTWQHALEILKWDFHESTVAMEDGENEFVEPEGIVARTEPLLFTRKGDRLMWKLKHKDFAGDNGRANYVEMNS